MKNAIKAVIGLALVTMSASSFAQVYAGYPDIPATGIAAGSKVIAYNPGPGNENAHDTTLSLGYPDNLAVALGNSGALTLGANPITVKGSGTTAADFYVYEAGTVELWDTYVSTDNETWVKLAPVSSVTNSKGTVRGYDVDSISSTDLFPYIKMVDISNSSISGTAGADIDGIVVVHGEYTGGGQIVDTDSRNGIVYNLEKDKETGAVDVKKINKDGSVEHIMFSEDDSLEPVALSVQGNFDCNDEKDINVLVTRKSDGIQLNIIKDQLGNDINTIDNSISN